MENKTNFISIKGKVEAKTPIFHGGNEKTGSSPILRMVMIWTEEGEIPLPYIHGNSIRGKLRRMIMKDLCDMVDYEIKNKKLYHALFSGGALESTADNSGVIDLALRKEIKDILPPVSLLGGCFGNQLIQGILVVGHLWPICKEYTTYLPQEFKSDPRVKHPIRTFIDEAFITRRDDLRAERKEDEQAVQMKVDYECFVPGTAFYHEFILTYANELERSCFARLLTLWQTYPVIGGRSASGDGQVVLSYDWQGTDEPYLQFVSKNRDSIQKLLQELEGIL